MEIIFKGVTAYDNGFGLSIDGYGKLEDIISVALGVRQTLSRFPTQQVTEKNFESNNCDITVTITPHAPVATVDGEDADKFLEEQYERIKKIAKKSKEN